MSYCNMICGPCGHESDIQEWITSRDSYRCPNCEHAFRVQQDPPKAYPNGFIMPGDRKLITISVGQTNKQKQKTNDNNHNEKQKSERKRVRKTSEEIPAAAGAVVQATLEDRGLGL